MRAARKRAKAALAVTEGSVAVTEAPSARVTDKFVQRPVVAYQPPDPQRVKELIDSIPADLSIPDFLRRDKWVTSAPPAKSAPE